MRRLALAALLALGGCIDFREITPPDRPPPEAPAEFSAFILLAERPVLRAASARAGGPDGFQINARLHPGRDARGDPRPIRDDTLRIAGSALAPSWVESDGTRFYEGLVKLPAPSAEGTFLRIEPPAVTGGPAPPVLFQAVPVRVGPDTLDLGDGADLSLPLSVPRSLPGPRPLTQHWSLAVVGEGASVGMTGSGLPPAPLLVPAGVLRNVPGSRLDALLSVSSHIGLGGGRKEDYSIEIRFEASLGWTVRRGAVPPEG